MNKYKLSIMIPTKGRMKQFQILFSHMMNPDFLTPDIQIVVACQSKEYFPDGIYPKNVDIIDTSRFDSLENSRILNYLEGFRHCKGKYTLILEDDDIVHQETIKNFIKYDYPMNLPLYIYDIINPEQSMFDERILIMKGKSFVYDFPRTRGSFQWGQCITKTSALVYYSETFWDDPRCNIVQSDELITLMIANETERIKISDFPFLYIGISDDNYSWHTSQEKIDMENYEYALRKYVLDDDQWIEKMKGMYK